MNFLIDNAFTIVVGIVALAMLAIYVIKFVRLPAAERNKRIAAWMLQAVMWAEKEYGSGTGKLKLSAVYQMFCTEIPWLAKLITFDKFSSLVDDALVEMNKLLESNDSIANFVNN